MAASSSRRTTAGPRRCWPPSGGCGFSAVMWVACSSRSTAAMREASRKGARALVRQIEAIALYEKLGFRRIAPYYRCPPELEAILIFMERDL